MKMSSRNVLYKTSGKILGPAYNYVSSLDKSLQESEINDLPFRDKVKGTKYQCILGAKKKYHVYLNEEKFHRYIVLHHEEEGTTYPFLTIEINTTKDCVKIIPVMRELQLEEIKIKWEISDIEIKLDILCETADKIVSDMGKYNVFTSDCQTFCNDLLIKLGLIEKPFPTLFGPDVSQK